MVKYYVNMRAQSNGDHEVHAANCDWLPKPGNRVYLGRFPSCHAAVEEAKKYYPQSNGCFFCANPCNTG